MARYAIKTPPHHATWAAVPRRVARRRRHRACSSRRGTGTTSTHSPSRTTDRTSRAGRCSPPSPRRPPASGSARWSTACTTATRRSPPTWRRRSTTSRAVASSSGMGAGWNEMESDAYGIPLGSLRERFDRFDEGIEVISSLLTNTVTNFSGECFQLENAWCEPKPVQDQLPIVIGGKGRRRTLRTAARWADQWDMTTPDAPADWLELDGVLREHCAVVGRDQSEIARSVHLTVRRGRRPCRTRRSAPAGSSTRGSTSSCGRCAGRSRRRAWSRWRTRSPDRPTRPEVRPRASGRRGLPLGRW